jgi:hypothetical protein
MMPNLLYAFDTNKIKEVFDHVRNLLVCALLIAAGLFETRHSTALLEPVFAGPLTGWGLVAVGSGLAIVNLLAGMSQLSKLPHSRVWITLMLCGYVLMSIRAMVVLTAFRACQ